MKQTNNAIKFLMAQYRAIFKNAYFKGMATAVVLTAGMAAGAANAASATDPIYSIDTAISTGNITSGTTTIDGSTTAYGQSIAGIASNTTYSPNVNAISSGSLTIGSDKDADFKGSLVKNVYGGFISHSTGNVSATHNTVFIKDSLKLGTGASTNSTASAYGAFAEATAGEATANNNKLEIYTTFSGTTTNNKNMIMGAKAVGQSGARVSENELFVSGTQSAKINLSKTTQTIGGHASNKKGSYAVGELIANSNKVTLEHTTYSKPDAAQDLMIAGGRAFLNNTSGSNCLLSAVDNQVKIDNSDFIVSGSTGNLSSHGIVGNIAWVSDHSTSANINTEASGKKDGHVALELTIVSIDNQGAQTFNIAGGQALTRTGSATANYNTVKITDSTFTKVNLFGGYAQGSGASATIQASDNSITLENTQASDVSKVKNITSGSIIGANLALTGTAADTNKLTANNNSLSIGDGFTFNGDTEINGVKIEVNTKDSSIITAKDNKVEFDSKLTGSAADKVLYSVYVENAGTAQKPESKFATLTGNSVTIGANAEIENYNIAAVYSSGAYALATNNDVTIHGKVKNGDIIGGAGADSLVSLESSGLLNYQSGSAGGQNSIISDNIKLAGTVNISSNDTLTLKGYYKNGNTKETSFNTSIANIDSTAHIYNQGTLELLGQTTIADGASLHAMSNGAKLIVSGGGTTIHDKVGSKKDTPVDLVGGRGSMKLSLATLNSYLKAGDKVDSTLYPGQTEDHAGAIVVKSGGVVEFTDKHVVLSDLDFVKDNTNPTAGKIWVESGTSTGGSIFKADEITIAHAFAANGSLAEKYTDLSGKLNANGIQVQAKVLNLGSNTLTSEQSKEVLFDRAIAKEEINFQVASGEANKDGFILQSEVYGSNFMRTRDQVSGKDYFTALDGKITGNVTISGGTTDQGVLRIIDGNWVAHDTITVSASGTLAVGGSSLANTDKFDPQKNPNITPLNNPDATLRLDKALVLDVSQNNGIATVNVNGKESKYPNVQYDPEWLENKPYHDRYVMLDLSNGVVLQKDSSQQIQGKAALNVTSGGVIRMNAEDVNSLLAQNRATTDRANDGVFFKANSGGTFEVKGDVEADFVDFESGKNGFNLVANSNAGQDDGILKADSLTVINKHEEKNIDEDSSYKAKELTLGGTVQVQDLAINDYQRTTGDKKPGNSEYASTVVLASGTAEIGKSLSSSNHILQLGSTAKKTSAHLELGTAANADKGTINVNTIELLSGSSVQALVGNWDASSTTFKLTSADSSLIIGGSGEDINGDDTTANLVAGGVVLGADSFMYVEADGSATVNGFDASGLKSGTKTNGANASANNGVVVAGTLVINGDKSAQLADGKADPKLGIKFGAEGSIKIENNGILKFSAQATDAAILKNGTYKGTASIKLDEGYKKIHNDGGELHLGLTSSTNFDGDAIKALKGALFTSNSMNNGVLNKGGILNIGDATFDGVNVSKLEGQGLSGYTATWESLKGFSDVYGNDVTNNTLVQTNVSDIKPGDQVQGHWGSLSVSANTASGQQVDLVGDTSLRFAQGNNGYFISNAAHNEALGATVDSQKSLKLIDGGKIGKITLQNGKSDALKNYTSLEIAGANKAIIASINSEVDNNSATLVKVNGDTEVLGDINHIAYVDVGQTGNLKAKNATVGEISTLNSNAYIEQTLTLNGADIVGGSVVAKDAIYGKNTLNDVGDLDIVNGGLFKADTLTVSKTDDHGDIFVGSVDLPADGKYQGVPVTGTGFLEVGTLELNNATLVIDPEYGSHASVSSVMKFKHGNESYAYANDVGTLAGNLLIGKNGIQTIGANKADTLKALANYLDGNGSLDKDNYGSILYLNGQLTMTKDSEIALNANHSKDTETIRDSLKYTIENQALDQYADLGLGANTAIFMTEKAFEDNKGERTGTAIFFDRNAAVVNGLGGDIVLAGDFDAATQLNIFNDLDDNGVDVKGSIDVRTQNGFLYATLTGDNQGKGVQLHVDKNKAYVVMNEASTPVVETLISYHEDRIVTGGATKPEGDKDSIPTTEIKPIENKDSVEASKIVAAQDQKTKEANSPSLLANGPVVNVPGDKPETPEGDKPESGNPDNGETQPKPPVNTAKITGSSDFLNEVVNTSRGAPAEAAARLAVYGGAMQAALAANNTSVEAISARMGMGASEISSIASNGQGGTLWVTPVYKSQDSDSFAAQGLDYGVDLNLYGLALGGDIEVAKNFKVGAMFNVGSGDADGKGNVAAASTSNDFNYYGFAVYGGYNFDAFSVSADLGYTVLDSDLEANTGMQNTSKLTASTDTKAITFGVTGKYTLSLDSGLEIAPHAGVRFTRFDMDSYTIKGNGNADVAYFGGDNLNVFSIPVGVTVSKEYVGESWTVKPSLDVTVTGNFGDDEVKGTVSWAGVNNLKTGTASEFVDNFTYGLSAGVSAQTGSFVMGAGISYTGSSNMSEFGVNANARFLF